MNKQSAMISVGEPGREKKFNLRQIKSDSIEAVEADEDTIIPTSLPLRTKGDIQDSEVMEKVRQELEGYFVK
jgi:hypothetical protein